MKWDPRGALGHLFRVIGVFGRVEFIRGVDVEPTLVITCDEKFISSVLGSEEEPVPLILKFESIQLPFLSLDVVELVASVGKVSRDSWKILTCPLVLGLQKYSRLGLEQSSSPCHQGCFSLRCCSKIASSDHDHR